jgi:hypothetical protein
MLPCKSGECSVGWDGNTKERLQGVPHVILANRLTFMGRPRPDSTPDRTDRALARSEPLDKSH